MWRDSVHMQRDAENTRMDSSSFFIENKDLKLY